MNRGFARFLPLHERRGQIASSHVTVEDRKRRPARLAPPGVQDDGLPRRELRLVLDLVGFAGECGFQSRGFDGDFTPVEGGRAGGCKRQAGRGDDALHAAIIRLAHNLSP